MSGFPNRGVVSFGEWSVKEKCQGFCSHASSCESSSRPDLGSSPVVRGALYRICDTTRTLVAGKPLHYNV